MAAPTFVKALGPGFTDAGGAWAYNSGVVVPAAIGNIIIVQILQDGSTSGATTLTTVGATAENLAGTGSALTSIGEFPVGASGEARQYLWIGRAAATSSLTFSGGNSTSEDLYIRAYEFTDGSTGTTLATVIENGTAGSTANGTGTGTTVSDTGVTTLGADRLALQLVGLNDDVAIDAFTGMSGGTWAEAVAEYADSGGTDGAIQLQTAAMASAGTIDGGSDTIVTAAWGVVGFALIGTTPDAPPTLVTPQPGIDFGSTAVLMGGLRRAWHRRRSGIFAPELWLPEGAIV